MMTDEELYAKQWNVSAEYFYEKGYYTWMAEKLADYNVVLEMSMPFLFCMFSPFKKCSFLVKKILLIKQCIDSFLFFFHEFFPFF